MIRALLIFAFTYLAISFEKKVRHLVDLPTAALIGGVAMVVAGVLTADQAYQAIDHNTIVFLFGMMLIISVLRAGYFFARIAAYVTRKARTPFRLLVGLVFASGLLSAFFVNDTICLIFTPIVLEVARSRQRQPLPYLLALATSANIGSAMAITGNPQNVIIGLASQIPYLEFLARLAPVTMIGLIVDIAVISLIYRKEFFGGGFVAAPEVAGYPVKTALLIKAIIASALLIGLWSFGVQFAVAAMAVASGLVLIARIDLREIYEGVDWSLLVFFCGLFVVVGGLEQSGVVAAAFHWAQPAFAMSPVKQVFAISGVSLVLSNLISNVPAVLLFRPIVGQLATPKLIWLVLAMSSTLAGNFTLLGSAANLIVVYQARQVVTISFWDYFKVGAIISLLTILIGCMILVLEFRLW